MSEAPSNRTDTFGGLIAVACWSTSVVTWRNLTEALGPVAAIALISTISAIFLMALLGRPDPRELPRNYLWIGAGLFVAYEICFAISLGGARSRQESIEVGIINYLWPTLTVLFGVLINGDRVGAPLAAGSGLSLAGVVLCMAGNDGLSLGSMLEHMAQNPVSYGLAFACAVFWALYSTLTRRMARGRDGTTLFILCSAIVSWTIYVFEPHRHFVLTHFQLLQACIAGAFTAAGCLLWSRGMSRGNLPILALSAYATPVLSAMLAAVWWCQALPAQFWTGVALLVAGSVIGGMAVQQR